MQKYIDLITQTFDFPDEEFILENNELHYNGLPLKQLIHEFGTPLKVTFLPKISQQIQKAKQLFNDAIAKYNYAGNYIYCYCTKSSHFRFVLEEALSNDIHLETSSTYDIEIIKKLFQNKKIDKSQLIICNGYKRDAYKREITQLINEGFYGCTPILDNINEIDYYKTYVKTDLQVGIRVAADEEPSFDFYTSRLGIRYQDVAKVYMAKIANDPSIKLKVLHFFINSGVKDTQYYWAELNKFIEKYCELKHMAPDLDTLDIGGGFPIKTSLAHNYDYEYMASQIVEVIQSTCQKYHVEVPHIITEFGNHTVGESGLMLYSILEEKLQNDKEKWYMIDGSFITHIPDTWAKKQKFILLAINNWDREYQNVHIGGLTCDSDDYYNSEDHNMNVFLPKLEDNATQYIGFFNTGAYQENLGGYGGLQHCLIPAARHIVVSKDEEGNFVFEKFRDEQESSEMLKLLGY